MAAPRTSWMPSSRRSKGGPWPEAVTRRLGDALDRFTRQVRGVEGVVAVILFGSYARGDFGRKSDVDLLVLVSRPADQSPERARAATIGAAIDAETEHNLPMHLAPLVADASAPEELGPDLLYSIWSDGVALFGEMNALAGLQPAGILPWAVVRYTAAGVPTSKGVLLSRRLHGRGERPGIVHSPAVELAPGALLLPAEQILPVRDVLDEVGATYDLIPVWRPV